MRNRHSEVDDWALEHGDARYAFNLVSQVVTVSMKNPDIIDELPTLRP